MKIVRNLKYDLKRSGKETELTSAALLSTILKMGDSYSLFVTLYTLFRGRLGVFVCL